MLFRSHVRHLGRGELVIPSDMGTTPGLSAADIVALFARAGVPVELSDNVVGALWGKLLLNCGYNAISAITDTPYGRMVTLPGIAQTVHDAVVECLAVAAALGVVIPGDVWAAIARIATSMPGQVSDAGFSPSALNTWSSRLTCPWVSFRCDWKAFLMSASDDSSANVCKAATN